MTRYHRILLLSLAFFLLMLVIALVHEDGILTVFRVEEEMGQMTQKNETLKEINGHIREEIEALKSNPLAIEKIAREKFNWVKPDETIYQIVRPQGETLESSESADGIQYAPLG